MRKIESDLDWKPEKSVTSSTASTGSSATNQDKGGRVGEYAGSRGQG